MYFYVGADGLKDLNECGRTAIRNENGEDIGGWLAICRDGTPMITDLFGGGETIYLDELELEEDHFCCTFATDDTLQGFAIYILKPNEYKTKWTRCD